LLPSNGRNNPIYLAPEVVQTRQATPTADIYAVAVVMIVLLTGSPPEELKTAMDMWNWEERCNISDRFIQILNIALSATRDFRYVNAGQMIRSLKPIIAIPDLISKAEDKVSSQFNRLEITDNSQGDISQGDFCVFQLPFGNNDDLSQDEVPKNSQASITN
jgi:hypothetical protein